VAGGPQGRREARAALAAAAMAVGAGAVVSRWPLAGISLVSLVAAAALAMRATWLRVVQGLLALLPWLLVFDAFTPPLMRTFVTAAAAVALIILALPMRYRSILGPVSAAVFAAVILGHAVVSTHADQFTQLTKYLIFPAVAAVVLSERGQAILPRVRNVVVVSGLAALTAHLIVVTAGLGRGGYKHGTGEQIGFGPAIPHELALLAVVIAAASLTMSERVSVQAGLFALGVIPALLTGVRSALLSAALIVLVMVFQSRLSARSLAVVGIVVAVALASGAQEAVTERLSGGGDLQEASGLRGLSSDRTAIWSAAVNSWWEPGPPTWLLGTGPASIPKVEERELNYPYIGHSDVVRIGVELGGIALAAWLLLWLALFRAGLNVILLIPVAVYAAVNGAISYVAPLALALVLSAACRGKRPRIVPRDTGPPPGDGAALDGAWRGDGTAPTGASSRARRTRPQPSSLASTEM
jgi:O-Antigen ligase